jgi:hypothetical protein
MTTKLPAVNEELAAYSHGAWAQWMKYMFGKCQEVPGGVLIPEPLVQRWTRQMNTVYRDLPEDEKKSDRDEAQKIMCIFVGDDDESHVP